MQTSEGLSKKITARVGTVEQELLRAAFNLTNSISYSRWHVLCIFDVIEPDRFVLGHARQHAAELFQGVKKMGMGNWKVIATVTAVSLWSFSGVSQAANIDCQDTSKNFMTVSDTQVSACVAAGVGNIGNGQNDDFLFGTGGGDALGYADVGDGAFNAGAGTWSFNASLWNSGPLAIGFKFGTGNTPDEWFIYTLVNNVSSGNFTFTCTLCNGNGNGGLSHVSIYSAPGDDDGDDDTDVPEPGTLALLGLGLMGLGMSRRRVSK